MAEKKKVEPKKTDKTKVDENAKGNGNGRKSERKTGGFRYGSDRNIKTNITPVDWQGE